jgi:ubiquinone/menaquinone biosynthesis C-methylase UbiE
MLNVKNVQAVAMPDGGYAPVPAVQIPEMWLGLEGQNRARYKFAREWVKEKNILDAVCGNGYGSALLYKSGAASVTGVDYSTEAIETASMRYNAPNLNYRLADLQNLPFTAEAFDVIVSFETLELVANYHQVLREFIRVLRPKGTLILSNPNSLVMSLGLEMPLNVRQFNQFSPTGFEAMLKGYFGEFQIFGQFIKSQNLFNTPSPHIYPSAEDFVFSTQKLEVAPFLVAICQK